MVRTPSLRELRLQRPANVAILPTATERKVQQRYGRAYAKAKREMIASQAVAFPFKFPGERQAAQRADNPNLRADVPPFDPCNPRHLRAWESIWDMGRASLPSDRE